MGEDQTTALRVGSLIRDNDPRMPNRVLRVSEFGNHTSSAPLPTPEGTTHLYAVHLRDIRPRIGTRVALKRVYTDGKPRKSGLNTRECSPITPAQKLNDEAARKRMSALQSA